MGFHVLPLPLGRWLTMCFSRKVWIRTRWPCLMQQSLPCSKALPWGVFRCLQSIPDLGGQTASLFPIHAPPQWSLCAAAEGLCKILSVFASPGAPSPHLREVAMSLYLPHSLSYEASSVWFLPHPLTLLPLVGSLIPSWLSPLGHHCASSQSTEWGLSGSVLNPVY